MGVTMAISIGGEITIKIREIAQLPESEADCRAFCLQVLGEECWQKVKGIRLLADGGASDVVRDAPSLELTTRGIEFGLTIKGTF